MDTQIQDTLENRRKKYIFRAGHRGTKEMDLLLGNFALDHVYDFDKNQLDEFEALLQINDPDLYIYKSGKENAPANLVSSVFELFMAYDFKVEK